MAEVAKYVPRTATDTYDLAFGLEKGHPTAVTEYNQLFEETMLQESETLHAVLDSIPPDELPQRTIEAYTNLTETHMVFDAKRQHDTYLETKLAKSLGAEVSVAPHEAETYQQWGLDPDVAPLSLRETGYIIHAGDAAAQVRQELAEQWRNNPESKARLDAIREFRVDRPYEKKVGKKLAKQIAQRKEKERERTGHLTIAQLLDMTRKDKVTPFAAAQEKAAKVRAYKEELAMAAD